MSLDLRKLEHLVAVAEEGGFTRAAERLHLSQQALSTSIRTLERHVGVRLLDRGHQHVTPTRPARPSSTTPGRSAPRRSPPWTGPAASGAAGPGTYGSATPRRSRRRRSSSC
ncbi:HTH-type transcriptional regulator ArgP [Streptomyces badius]